MNLPTDPRIQFRSIVQAQGLQSLGPACHVAVLPLAHYTFSRRSQ